MKTKYELSRRGIRYARKSAAIKHTAAEYNRKAKAINKILAIKIPKTNKLTPAQKGRITKVYRQYQRILERPYQIYYGKNKATIKKTAGIPRGSAKLRGVPLPIFSSGKKTIRVKKDGSVILKAAGVVGAPSEHIILFDQIEFGKAVKNGTVDEYLKSITRTTRNRQTRVFDLKLNHDGVVGVPSQGEKADLIESIEAFTNAYGIEATAGAIIGIKIIDFPKSKRKETPQQRTMRYANSTRGLSILKNKKRK